LKNLPSIINEGLNFIRPFSVREKMNPKCYFLLLIGLSGIFLQQPGYSQKLPPENIYQFTSEKEAKEIIFRISDAVGLRPNFEIKAGDVNNAAAIAYRGKRYIIYNPVFIRQITKAAQTDWGSISILAHEVGHHLNGHTLTSSGSKPDLELEADEFSGYVLRKMGATLDEAQAAMKVLASKHDSPTHPGQNKRLASIERGWRHAQEQIASIYKPEGSGKTTKGSITTPQPEEVEAFVFPAKYIFRKIHFDKFPERQFYITVESNFIHVDNNGYTVLGKLVRQGKSLFLTMGDRNYLIVSPKGTILNKAKQRVGYFSS
jgi:hypothetical protein